MSTQDFGTYDVVVVGSGAAGSTAAIASARSGASTLLVEKLPFLGGNSTAVLDTFYGFFTPGDRPRKVVGGIGDDVLSGLESLGPVLYRPNTYGAGTGVTYVAEHLKVVWESMVTGAGCDVLLHAFVQDATVTDGRITDLLIATKAGLVRVHAAVVIDASGDADVCHHAGFGYEMAGTLAPAQTLTTTFRMANVDNERRSQISKDDLHALMKDAADSGDFDLPRREGSDHATPVPYTTATVMTRLGQIEHRDGVLINATDPELLTRAEMDGRRQALEFARFLIDRVPGYEHASLIALSSQIGMRETRRVYGDYRVSRDDVLSAKQFDDQIGLCGAPIEDHHGAGNAFGVPWESQGNSGHGEGVGNLGDSVPGELGNATRSFSTPGGTGTTWEYLPEGTAVGIPHRSLIVRDSVNTFVAGRCFSATHDAQASIRSMAQCMAMGQAVGTAAAMAAAGSGESRSVDGALLTDQLRSDGAVLSVEEAGVA